MARWVDEIKGKVVWVNDALWLVQDAYEGDVDLSYHGSASYEKFIVCENIYTKEVKTFGDESYSWFEAESYIKRLEENRRKVKREVETLFRMV